MPTTLQFRRGTAAQNDAYTGASGEITVDTTNKTLRVHDGSTAGGTRLGKYTEVEAVDSAVVTSIIDSAIGSTIQALLVSGTNIKTINSQSILGSGNITITGGDGGSGTLDSTTVLGVINAAYIQANQITYSTADFPDSAGVIALISANETTYTNVSEFVNDANYLDSTTVTGLIDSAYVQARQASGAGTDPIFKTIAVSGQSDVVADTTADTLTFIAGTGISITTDAGADAITITATGGGGGGTLDSTTVLDVIDTAYIQANQITYNTADFPDSAGVIALIGANETTYTNVSEFVNDANYLDSTTVQGVINASYVQSNQTTYNTSDFLDSSSVTNVVDAAYVQARQTTYTNVSEFVNDANYLDSTTVQGVIDPSYVQSNQTTYNTSDFLDSSSVTKVVDAAYVQARQITYSTADFPDSAGATTLANAAITSAVGSTVQAQLVSGTNIKTVNSQSLLGSGNITISGGSGTLDSSTALGVIDDHLNTGTAGTGEVLSWTGSDYDWVAQSGGAGGGIAYDDSAQDKSTGWFGLPVGTTDQRDSAAVPADGAIRVNSTTDFLEAYYEGGWIDVKNLGVATATGGTVTEADGYKYHAFTTGGTFEVTKWPVGTTADIIIVGGGGGGGGGGNNDAKGGGGGAGGVILLTGQTLSVTSYSITIGSGGSGGTGLTGVGTNGSDTVAFSNTAYGGGAGGAWHNSPNSGPLSGASGGGAGTGIDVTRQTGATSSYPSQGNDGGDADGTAGSSTSGGGGGGAGAAGADAVTGTAGNGGAGYDASTYFAAFGESGFFGGGGGGGRASSAGGGAGGNGGGGAGAVAPGNGTNGDPNTGGGGGGAGSTNTGDTTGGSGGSGIVVIRYAV